MEPRLYPVTVAVSSIVLAGIIGNLLICFTVLKAQMYKKQMYVLILALALTDLLDELLVLPAFVCALFNVQRCTEVPFLSFINYGNGWWGLLIMMAHFTDVMLLSCLTMIQAIGLDKKGWIEQKLRSCSRVGGLLGFCVLLPFVLGEWIYVPSLGLSQQILNDTVQKFVLVHDRPVPFKLMSFLMFNLLSLTCAAVCAIGNVLIVRKIRRFGATSSTTSGRWISGSPPGHNVSQGTTSTSPAATLQIISNRCALQFLVVNSLYLTFIALVSARFLSISVQFDYYYYSSNSKIVDKSSWNSNRSLCSPFEEKEDSPQSAIVHRVDLLQILLDFVTQSIYAFNFYVYLVFNRNFRDCFLESVHAVCGRKNHGQVSSTVDVELVVPKRG